MGFISKKKQEAIYNDGVKDGAIGTAGITLIVTGVVGIVKGTIKFFKNRKKKKNPITYVEYLESKGVQPRYIDYMNAEEIGEIAGRVVVNKLDEYLESVDDEYDNEFKTAMEEVLDAASEPKTVDEVIDQASEAVGKAVDEAEAKAIKTTRK